MENMDEITITQTFNINTQGMIDDAVDNGYVLNEGVTREQVAEYLRDAKCEQVLHDIEEAQERHRHFGDWADVIQTMKSEFFTFDEDRAKDAHAEAWRASTAE
jgi:hypothetical protein